MCQQGMSLRLYRLETQEGYITVRALRQTCIVTISMAEENSDQRANVKRQVHRSGKDDDETHCRC